jgi:hypothetical protein
MVSNFLSAFILTVIVEFILGCFILDNFNRVKLFLIIFFMNLLSLPFVWFLFPIIFSGYWTALLLSELFIFFLEAFLFRFLIKISFRKAIELSFFLNFATFIFGVLFF